MHFAHFKKIFLKSFMETRLKFGLMEGPDQTPLSAEVVCVLTFELVRPLVGRVAGVCSRGLRREVKGQK